jgi:hypothetical protein
MRLARKASPNFILHHGFFGWVVSLVVTWWWSGDIGFHCHRFTYISSLPLFFFFLKINYISICIPFVQPSYLSHVSKITWLLTQQIIVRAAAVAFPSVLARDRLRIDIIEGQVRWYILHTKFQANNSFYRYLFLCSCKHLICILLNINVVYKVYCRLY